MQTDAAYRVHVDGHVGLRGRLVVRRGAGVHRGRDLDQTCLLENEERSHK